MEKRCPLLLALILSVLLAFSSLGVNSAKVERFRRQATVQTSTDTDVTATSSTNMIGTESSTEMITSTMDANITTPNNETQNQNSVASSAETTMTNLSPTSETSQQTSNPPSIQPPASTTATSSANIISSSTPLNSPPSTPETTTNQPGSSTSATVISQSVSAFAATSPGSSPINLQSSVSNAVSSTTVPGATAIPSISVVVSSEASTLITASTPATSANPTAATTPMVTITVPAAVSAASTSAVSNPISASGETTVGTTMAADSSAPDSNPESSVTTEAVSALEQTVSSGAETDYPDEAIDTSVATQDLKTTEAQMAPTLTSTTKPSVTGASKVSGITKRTSNGPVRAADPKKLKCNTLNAKQLLNCCENPKLTFFIANQKLSCNQQRNSPALFAHTIEYALHKLQGQKNNMIDFSSSLALKAIGNSACFAECLFKDIRAFSNNVVNEVVLASHLSRDQDDDEWISLITDATTECVQDTTALRLKKNDKGNERKFTKGCSFVPALVMQCILKNVYESCPVTQNTNTTQCLRVKERFSLCDPLVTKATDVFKRRNNKQKKRGGLKNRNKNNRRVKSAANNPVRKSKKSVSG